MATDAAATARRLKVLADATRARIVQLLAQHTLCVYALASRLHVTEGAVSQHLRVLRDAGLVTGERRGYYVHYRLNERTLEAWRKALNRLLDPALPCHGVARRAKPGRPTSEKKGASRCPAATRRKKAAENRKT